MSQRIQVTFTCAQCKTVSEEEIFRSIWGEKPGNRELVFTDKINRLTCKNCGRTVFVNRSLMYTNADLRFAVWYEPEHDPQIDAEAVTYQNLIKGLGPSASYLAQALRIRDWDEFKATIERFERGELVSESRSLQSATANKQRPVKTGKGCLLLLGFIVCVTVSLIALVVNAALK